MAAPYGPTWSASLRRGSETELRAWLDLALGCADAADAIALRHFRRDLEIATKPDRTYVTQADREIETLVRERIRQRHPEHGIVGEEYGEDAPAAPVRWYIDPIDGTHNYLRGIPVFATLLAVERDGELQAGVLSAPALGERWFAWRGGGAWASRGGDPEANGAARTSRGGHPQASGAARATGGAAAPARDGDRTGGGAASSGGGVPAVGGARSLHVSRISALGDAQLLHGSENLERSDLEPRLRALLGRAWRVRGFGDFWSYSLVAEGAAEAMIEDGVHPWDLAAPMILVEEAGGRFTDFSGARRIDAGSAVATNGLLHEEILRSLTVG